jgi:hypothetical protein
MAAIGAVAAIAFGFIAVRTLASGDFSGAALMILLILLLAWQIVPLILRNRPRRYDPQHIPAEVLPAGGR